MAGVFFDGQFFGGGYFGAAGPSPPAATTIGGGYPYEHRRERRKKRRRPLDELLAELEREYYGALTEPEPVGVVVTETVAQPVHMETEQVARRVARLERLAQDDERLSARLADLHREMDRLARQQIEDDEEFLILW